MTIKQSNKPKIESLLEPYLSDMDSPLSGILSWRK